MSDYVELKLDFLPEDGDDSVACKNLAEFLKSDFGKVQFGLHYVNMEYFQDQSFCLRTGFGARTWPEVYKQYTEGQKMYGYKLYKQVTVWEEVK